MRQIERQVLLSYRDVIHVDFEGFLDLLSTGAVGNDTLMDINYALTGVKGELLIFNVTGELDEEV